MDSNTQQYTAQIPGRVQHVSWFPTAGSVIRPQLVSALTSHKSSRGQVCQWLPPLPFQNFHSTLTVKLHNANTVASVVAAALLKVLNVTTTPVKYGW